jgi:hypothetical protein
LVSICDAIAMKPKQRPPHRYLAHSVKVIVAGDLIFVSGRSRGAIAPATDPCRAEFEPEQLACFAGAGQNHPLSGTHSFNRNRLLFRKSSRAAPPGEEKGRPSTPAEILN